MVATGLDGATNERILRRAAARLRKADPPFTPADVRQFVRRYAELCPWAEKQGRDRPTLNEVVKYVGRIRAVPSAPAGPTAAELEATTRAKIARPKPHPVPT